jgi:hypothetical protein
MSGYCLASLVYLTDFLDNVGDQLPHPVQHENIIPITLIFMQIDPDNITHYQYIYTVILAQNTSWGPYLYYAGHKKMESYAFVYIR